MQIKTWPKLNLYIKNIEKNNINIEIKKNVETVPLNNQTNNHLHVEQKIVENKIENEVLNPQTLSDKQIKLDKLKKKMENFEGIAFKAFANLVFANGNIDSKLMIIGEAPGQEEDIQKKPFVGRSGTLLSSLLNNIGFNIANCYITNFVNWRPPGNRTPTALEVEFMKPFIFEHIEIIKPKLIITVGAISTKGLGIATGITFAQGNLHQVEINNSIYNIFPVYHPAYCLRLPAKKRELWLSLLKMHETFYSL